MPTPPINPDSFDKVNYVIDAWATGCDAPWYIYIETMKPALMTAFITLITFGFDDVLRGFFRPKGLYKRRTGKRKGKWTKRIPRFPEIGNTLGKQLPGSAEVRGTKWSVLGKTLWRMDGAMEAIRFFWLVAAVTEDFAFDWTSVLYESYWCLPDPEGNFSHQSGGLRAVTGGVWHVAIFSVEDYENAPPDWNHWLGMTGDNPATITAALQFTEVSGYGAPEVRSIRIADYANVTTYAETQGTEQDDQGGYGCVASGNVPPNTIFRVFIQHDRPWADYGDGVVLGREVLPQ